MSKAYAPSPSGDPLFLIAGEIMGRGYSPEEMKWSIVSWEESGAAWPW
jgi:hypothetical protein